MPRKKKLKTIPTPEELEGEALLEWERITAELAKLDRLDAVDRAIMLLHCQWWAVYQQLLKPLQKFGPVLKYSNGTAGLGPFFVGAKTAAAMVKGTLDALGLTPESRGFKSAEPKKTAALTF